MIISINNKIKQGQILIMVLLVLMIVGITATSITNNIVRDSIQSRANIDYDNFYASSESYVKLLIEENEQLDAGLNNIVSAAGSIIDDPQNNLSCDQNSTQGVYDEGVIVDGISTEILGDKLECEVTEDEQGIPVITKILVRDNYDIDDAPIHQDEILMWKVDPVLLSAGGSNPDEFTVTIRKEDVNITQVALEVIIDIEYEDTGSVIRQTSVRGVFDPDNMFTLNASAGDFIDITENSVNDPDIYQFTFKLSDVFSNYSNLVKYIGDVGSLSGITSIRFKPYIEPSGGSTIYEVFVTVTADNHQQVTQSRTIKATTYKQADDAGSNYIFGARPIVETRFGFHILPSILDYVSRSTGDITVGNSSCSGDFTTCETDCLNKNGGLPNGSNSNGNFECYGCIKAGNYSDDKTKCCPNLDIANDLCCIPNGELHTYRNDEDCCNQDADGDGLCD